MQTSEDSKKNELAGEIEALVKEGRKYIEEAAASLDSAVAITACDKAIEVLRRARELAGNDDELKAVIRLAAAQAYSQRGHQHRYTQNFKDAVSDLSLAIRYDPEYADDYYYRGMSYLKMNEEKQAVKDLNEFIRKADDNILKQDAEQILESLVSKENPQKVMEHWRSEGQRLTAEAGKYSTPPEGQKPDYATAVNLYNRALEAFEKAKKLAPKDMMNNISYLGALRSQADCYLALGEYDLAIVNLDKAINQQSNPNDVFKRGEAYFKIGKRAAAQTDLNLYLKTGKDPETIQLAQQYLAQKDDR